MSGLFSTPDIPAPPPIPGSPIDDSAEKKRLQEKQEATLAAERKIRGKAATMLTGPDGVTENASLSRRTLLGA